MDDNWQDNPKLAGIDKNKLDMLQQMARQGAGKSPSDLLPFIMNAASQGRNAGLNFNSNEINTIIEVLKMGKSPRGRYKSTGNIWFRTFRICSFFRCKN